MGAIYRTSIVGTGTEADPFRPPYDGDSRIGWIDLGPSDRTAGVSIAGVGLLYLPDEVVDARLTKIADTAAEASTGLTRTRLGNALGITLARGNSVADVLAEVLMDHGRTDGTRWIGIRGAPSKARGGHEVWLGALGRIWFEPVPPTPSTQSFTETWPTTGAITSGQDQTWTNISGTAVVAGGRLSCESLATLCSVLCSSALDTASQRHTANFEFAAANVDAHNCGVQVRKSDDSNFYDVIANRRTSLHDRIGRKRVAGAFTVIIADDNNDPGSTGTIVCAMDGSTLSLQIGSYTNTGTDGSPQLTTNLNGGCRMFAGSVLTSGTLDGHTIEDIVAPAPTIPITAIQWHRFGSDPYAGRRPRRRARHGRR